MCEYKNGKIYKLVCEITGEVYIGSTKRSLEDRLSEHLKKYNPCCSKQIIDRNKYYIEQLESYPCNSKQELERKEGEYQRAFKCINKNIAGRTDAEYYQDNKELIKEDRSIRCRQYYLENTEKIKARINREVICECGIKSIAKHLPRHKRSKKHIDLMSNLNQPSSDPLVLEMPVQNQAGRISSH